VSSGALHRNMYRRFNAKDTRSPSYETNHRGRKDRWPLENLFMHKLFRPALLTSTGEILRGTVESVMHFIYGGSNGLRYSPAMSMSSRIRFPRPPPWTRAHLI